MAGSQGLIDVRQLFSLDEFSEVLRLQQVIWGFRRNRTAAAPASWWLSARWAATFSAHSTAGDGWILLRDPGCEDRGPAYLHSHMLGVLPQYHNAGIGRRLKLATRGGPLARNHLIEWTFDPLELKNAFFNVERLGAIVRRYSENQYGVTASPLHGGLPTDRCIAEW